MKNEKILNVPESELIEVSGGTIVKEDTSTGILTTSNSNPPKTSDVHVVASGGIHVWHM